MAGEDVVVLPLVAEAEQGLYASTCACEMEIWNVWDAGLPVEVAFAVEPGSLEPLELSTEFLFQLPQLGVVPFDVREAIAGQRREFAVVL